jgi:hypothetical protein
MQRKGTSAVESSYPATTTDDVTVDTSVCVYVCVCVCVMVNYKG